MKKLLIMIGAVCYCVAPDLFLSPMDDAVIVLASMAYTLLGAKPKRDPEHMNWNVDL